MISITSAPGTKLPTAKSRGGYERRAEAKLLSFAGQGVPTKLGNIQETFLLNPVNLSAKTKEKFFTIRCVSCS
jgi:hypothetical protein